MKACSFFKTLRLAGILFFFTLFAAVSASADLIYNINFSISNTMDGTAWTAAASPVSYGGNTWNDKDYGSRLGNVLIDVSLDNILDSQGNSSTIDFATQSNGVWDSSTSLYVLQDYIYTYDREGDGDPSRTFAFSGLDTGLTYDIYFLAANNDDTQLSTFTINGESYSTSDNDSVINGSLAAMTTWAEGNNYVMFSGLTADVTGAISGVYTAINTFGPISGIQLVAHTSAVPQPSSCLLLFVGLFSLAAVKKLRKFR